MAVEDEKIALLYVGIVFELQRLPQPCRQLALHFFKERLEVGEVLARIPLGDFLGGVDFLPRADVDELRDIARALRFHTQLRQQFLIARHRHRFAEQPLRIHVF